MCKEDVFDPSGLVELPSGGSIGRPLLLDDVASASPTSHPGPFSKTSSYLASRACHTSSSRTFDEASLTSSLHKTDDDDVEFLPLALIYREKMTEKPKFPS